MWKKASILLISLGILSVHLVGCGGKGLSPLVKSGTVNFPTPTPTPTSEPTLPVTLNVSPIGSLFFDTAYTLSWNVPEADNCNLFQTGQALPLQSGKVGSRVMPSLKQNETFQLTCSRGSETASDPLAIMLNVPTQQIIFLTDFTAGNFGGLTQGDQICQTAAGNILPGRPWRAILSSSTVDARDRIKQFVPITNNRVAAGARQTIFPLGTLWTNSTPFDIDTPGFPHFGYDSTGDLLQEMGGTDDNAWTGTLAGGTKSTLNCNNWTVGDGSRLGTLGDSNGNTGDNSWVNHAGDSRDCNSQYRLYCINH